MIANPEVDIKQCALWAVEEIAVIGVALIELVTGLGVRVEPGTLLGGEEGGGEEREDGQQAERAHDVSHPLTARVPLSLSSV